MLKKLNNKLLSKYPLIWNLKLLYVIPAALLIHLLFYIAGYMTEVDITLLHKFQFFEEFSTGIFATLVSIIIIILWLVYYLRNNPFKSFYTLSRNYQFAEFLLIALVFFSTGTFFFTFQQGKYDKVEDVTDFINLEDEINTVNLSGHFIAYDWEDFTAYNSCDFKRDREYEDSIRKAKKKDHHAQLSNYMTKPADYGYRKGAPYKDEGEVYSYLNYCGRTMNIDIDGTLNKYQLDAIAKKWLTENYTDSVLNLFKKLTKMCKKYNIKYDYSADEQVAECFGDSAFTVNRLFENRYSEYSRNTPPYIDVYRLTSSLDYIHRIRKGFWSVELFLFWLLSALGAAVLLFSFRITRLKHWFMGLIGEGLWSIIITLCIVIFRLEKGIIPFILLIWVCLTALGVKQILSKTNKLLSGVIYNWVFWFTPFVLPLIALHIDITTNASCYSFITKRSNSTLCKLNHWIDKHWVDIHFINVVICLAAIYFIFIPLARKWQSNPEE